MGDSVKQMLTKLIHLTDQITKAAKEAGASFKQELAEIVFKTEKLAAAVGRAVGAGCGLYKQPAHRIIHETEQVLRKALSLVLKCKADGLVRRVFCINPAVDFRDMSSQLDDATESFLWLLRIMADDRDEEYISLSPIAAHEPILCLIREQLATLSSGSVDDRSDAAASLAAFASDNVWYGKMIIEEGGARLLLKLLKEGRPEDQKNAAKAIGCLGQDPDSVDHLLIAGVCSVFEKILKEGPMMVQAMVAWALSELARNHPECQGVFAQSSIMRLLVAHLASEIVHDHSKFAVVINKATSVRALVNAIAYSKQREKERALGLGLDTDQVFNNNEVSRATGDQKPEHLHAEDRELEDPATKANMKAMAARALGQLAKGNPAICRNISESRALMCFVVLLEKGAYEVRYNSAVALMEITAVAEKDADLRRSVFKPNSPACKAVVDQLLRVIEKVEAAKLLVPCIKAVGNLATTWTAGRRLSTPLVKFLNHKKEEVCREAIVTLSKLACPKNYLHVDHSKAIISGGGAERLVSLCRVFYYSELGHLGALRLLCYISLHVPYSEELAAGQVFYVLEWASKQAFINQDQTLVLLLADAKSRLEPYRCRTEANDFVLKSRSFGSYGPLVPTTTSSCQVPVSLPS